ncbi:hypothetical protein BBF96_00590 [Anoxybacter fermentans]|uniref:CRISPR type III-B/RAMP module-associated protein Cmr5 n=1 Tax=Anoxybacter fermentans TaxID=1323375 RepID=A0A3Q9HNG9_9FIRM|nr:hypothetical protein [Anoxybacter fermentans]AZR72033.1 hypothetical protein BBF96_00590 [Anoxybacter fermentans]
MRELKNLEKICAEKGHDFVEKVKEKNKSSIVNTVNKAMGILQENGIYAYFIWLNSRSSDEEKVIARELINTSENLLEDYDKEIFKSQKGFQSLFEADDIRLNSFIMMKKLLYLMLTYALYIAKGLSDKSDEQGEDNG